MARDDWFITFTGQRLYLLDPEPSKIEINDIAHALSRQCRFNGHTREFYSVAQHSVLVSKLVPQGVPIVALCGLLHDATEAFLGDMIRPLKRLLPAYSELEAMWWEAIARAYKLPLQLPEVVKHADHVMLQTERRDLLNPVAGVEFLEDRAGYQPAHQRIKPMNPDQARTAFLDRFWELVE